MSTVDDPARLTTASVTVRRLALLASATLLAPLLLVVEYLRAALSQLPAIAAACAVLFLLVVARLWGLIIEQQKLASTDALPGLRTRRYFADRLGVESSRAGQLGAPLSLIIIDADHFKSINDTHGHPAGDAVLIELGERLRQVCRSTDVLARFGGEEFVILLPGTPVETAGAVAERIRTMVAAVPIRLVDGVALPVTVSVGVASLGTHCVTAEALLRIADEALYRAKHGGRNRVEIGNRPAVGTDNVFQDS